MKRLTTDSPKDNLELMINFVFGCGGWACIRHDGERENVPLTTWAKEQCIKRGCDEFPGETPEEIDEMLCDCLADGDGCPVALAYCFASQACHLRSRLKLYEDTGKDPMGRPLEGQVTTDSPPNTPLTLAELREMDGEPVWIVGVSSINNFKGHWDICNWVGGRLAAFPYCLESPNEDEYGITWFAYRHKLEEVRGHGD